MIVASAVRLRDGHTFVGSRHGDAYTKMIELGVPKEYCECGATQGFITDKLTFMDRETAYYHAFSYKQCKEQKYTPTPYANGLGIKEEDWKPSLSSEDLW